MELADMQNSWFKEYADLGHAFDKPVRKCVRCGVPAIDLFEDGIYGPLRACTARLKGEE